MESIPAILFNLPGEYVANMPRKFVGVNILAKTANISCAIENDQLIISTNSNPNNKLTMLFQVNATFIECFTAKAINRTGETLVAFSKSVADDSNPFDEWLNGSNSTTHYVYQLKFEKGVLSAMRIQACRSTNLSKLSYELELCNIEKIYRLADQQHLHYPPIKTDWKFGSKY